MWEVVMYREGQKLTSTFTISSGALFLLFLVTSFAWARPEHRDAVTLEQRVERLGSKGNSDVQDIQELAANPEASVPLLIAGLHIIPDSPEFAKEDAPSMEHVLWMIRGLRYMTGGLDFCAKSNHRFGKSEEERDRYYWLTFQHTGCMRFWGFWMSRGRFYIAPPDAQRSIIAQWQRWYATRGKTFEYKPLRNPPPEKWLW
jgi:hypothetical protein